MSIIAAAKTLMNNGKLMTMCFLKEILGYDSVTPAD